jgi:alkanesulfonate monooxygenase SsuD/methylene tetrahydromethanopterin reductase-like flavin-dependent oxidoreductase (luciferase family)
MGTPISFGVSTTGDAAEVARLEQMPYLDSLWVGGHVVARQACREVVTTLAHVAALTSRVDVGTAVLVPALYHPVVLGKQLADIDVRSGGRVKVGVGVGGDIAAEFPAVGVPVSERGQRTSEILHMLRLLWSQEGVSYEGSFYSVSDVTIAPRPSRPAGLPIIVAGRNTRAMERAVRFGQGWLPYFYTPHRYARSVTMLRERADALDVSLHGFEWAVYLHLSLDEHAQSATDLARAYLRRSFHVELDGPGASGTVYGDAADVADQINAYVSAGARHFVLVPCDRGRTADVIDRFFDSVFPRLDHVVAT